jgi:hypothetical protein
VRGAIVGVSPALVSAQVSGEWGVLVFAAGSLFASLPHDPGRYIDLRGKLDWAKSQSQKQVTKILTQTSKLETKWSLLQSGGLGSVKAPPATHAWE